MKQNIFLTGFSGTGKTTVAREVARVLGWRAVDTDDEIVTIAGKPIDAIFRDHGESRFRELERECLARVCRAERQVIATGGGMVTDSENRRRMEMSGAVICLEARPDTILQRLTEEGAAEKGPVVRPMLADPDPLRRIRDLKSQRQPDYSLAHWTVHTDSMTPSETAAEVVRASGLLNPQGATSTPGASDLAATVRTSSGEYPVWVGWGTLPQLGQRVSGILSAAAAYVITDEGAQRHARRAQASLEADGIPAHIFILPPGERSKSLEMAEHLYQWLAGRRAERGHLLVAVGGGVVGDLTGFVAATFLRGVPYGHVPTTLLGMMDAAIGGKTAVDLPQGKNLVGAFYQPRFVLSDVQTLQSLSDRDRKSGWAEAIKHGLILDEGLLSDFEDNAEGIVSLDEGLSTDIIRRSVAIKADVVSRDERETLGVRVLLNYGHTIGHALEASTGYQRFLHGEAVSIGMIGAARIGKAMGMLSDEDVQRHQDLLRRFGLPVHADDIDARAVRAAMGADKKTAGGTLRWVLLDGIGRAVTREDVPSQLVDSTIRSLGSQV